MYWRSNDPGLPYPNDFDPIVTASYFGHTFILKPLLSDSLANKTDVRSRALCWASRMGHYDVVNLLLQEEEVDPNRKYADDETALTLAIRFNRTHVVQRLLEDEGFIPEANEYRVNYAGKDGQTPLSTDAKNGALLRRHCHSALTTQ
ncbi:MAG: hypothetical protein L6R42_000830 [Xanthoria sp. 1 TBL-2021]|nr:MAG: hypothetical protein L6R42_000830 [Xanthoria sp. 1 TBL-2021]